jgi:integrase
MPKLTAVQVKSEKPRAARIELPDGGCTGLYLIIQPSGKKSWAVRYRYLGKPRKLTLGTALVLEPGEPEPASVDSALTLAAARKLATDALLKVRQGIDPAKDKQDNIRKGGEAAAVRAADTVENLSAQFIDRYCKVKNRSWAQTEAIFNNRVLPKWSGRVVHEITKEDVQELVDEIAEEFPILANRTLSWVRKWFAWMGGRYKGGKKAQLKSRLVISPCIGIEPPGEEKSRDRVLSDDEIKALWNACGQQEKGGIGQPFGGFIRLLLLTGQRRTEVAGMRWSELDIEKRLWTLPADRTKNKRLHTIPLPTQAIGILEAAKLIDGSDFVFPSTGKSHIVGFSRCKERLDRIMKPAKPWALHDLRRSAATGMSEIGVAPHIVEAILNHVSGHRAGVAGIYNRAAYATEKADALQRWADHVERLANGQPASRVIPFRGPRQ